MGPPKKFKTVHRLRMSAADAHYGGNLVDGARLLKIFGDVATDLMIQTDGVEGLLRAYSRVEFLAPVSTGDFLEVEGEVLRFGKTSRAFRCSAYKVIEASRNPRTPDRARVLSKRQLVGLAEGTCVVGKKK